MLLFGLFTIAFGLVGCGVAVRELVRRARRLERWPEYRVGELTIRTRGQVVADLVAGDEVLLAGRPEQEVAQLYREITGRPWSRAALEGKG